MTRKAVREGLRRVTVFSIRHEEPSAAPHAFGAEFSGQRLS
jgi:hypothetical protein